MSTPIRSSRAAAPPSAPAPAPLAQPPTAPPPAARGAAPIQHGAGPRTPGWLERAINTLRGQFLLLGALILLLCLGQAYVVSRTFAEVEADLMRMTRSSVPSIEAAQAMAQRLEELDTQAAIYLTSANMPDPQPCLLIGGGMASQTLLPHECAALNLDAGILHFNRHLYEAAHNVTYQGERTAIERITAGFQEYVAHLTVMRYEYDAATSPGDFADPAMQRALAAYQSAYAVLHEQPTRHPTQADTTLITPAEGRLPACEPEGASAVGSQQWPNGALHLNLACLSDINESHLQAAYTRTQSYLDTGWYLAMGLAVALGALLGFTTLRMAFVSRRIVNPGLTLALLGGLVLGFGTLQTLGNLSSSFNWLIQQYYVGGYETVALQRAATAAHASQARWLLAHHASDPALAAQAEQGWQQSVGAVQQGLSALAEQGFLPAYSVREQFQEPWLAYSAIHDDLYAQVQASNDLTRLETATRTSLDSSVAAFNTFLEAVHDEHRAVDTMYESERRRMEVTLAQYRLSTMLFFPLVGLLALWGIALRLRDF